MGQRQVHDGGSGSILRELNGTKSTPDRGSIFVHWRQEIGHDGPIHPCGVRAGTALPHFPAVHQARPLPLSADRVGGRARGRANGSASSPNSLRVSRDAEGEGLGCRIEDLSSSCTGSVGSSSALRATEDKDLALPRVAFAARGRSATYRLTDPPTSDLGPPTSDF